MYIGEILKIPIELNFEKSFSKKSASLVEVNEGEEVIKNFSSQIR